MNLSETTKKQIRLSISTFVKPKQILVFGSTARGDNSPHSDIDLLVIVGETYSAKEKIVLKSQIRKSLLYNGILSDILIQSDVEIENKRHLPGHII